MTSSFLTHDEIQSITSARAGSTTGSLHAIASSKSLSDLVADYLIQQLVSGGLAQGQRVNEAELSRALGISRNPIREAINGLQERGMLIAAPRRGSFVRRFTLEDVNAIFSFRLPLELFIVERAVEVVQQSDIARLTDLLATMRQDADRGDILKLRRKDTMFHMELARLSGNRHAIHAFANLATEMMMLLTTFHTHVESPHASVASHLPIIDALTARSKPAARSVMKRHLREAWDIMLQLHADRPADGHGSLAA